MAWQIDFHSHTSSIQSGEWSYPVALTWGTFVVHALRYSYNTTKAIINFRDISSLIPVAYICNDLTDFADTEGVPHNFIDAVLGNGTVEIDLSASESKTIFIGVRPATTSDIGVVTLVSNFETSGGGGGGEDDMRFSAVGDSNAGSIAIDVLYYSGVSYDYFDYRIEALDGSYSDHYSTASSRHTFTGLSGGVYKVSVQCYFQDGGDGYILSVENTQYMEIPLDGGGGGDDWQLIGEDKGVISSLVSYPLNGLEAQRLYSYSFQLETAGTVTISSGGGADTVGWLSDWDQTSWGTNSSGTPDKYVPDAFLVYNDDGGDNRNFSLQYNCQAKRVYYLWFRTYGGQAYTGDVTITITPSSATTWSYDGFYDDRANLSNITTQGVTVAPYTGARFRVSFANAGTAKFTVSGTSAFVYVTTGNYGWTVNGVPLDENGREAGGDSSQLSYQVSASTYYYIWVQGATANTSGTVTITIEPPGASTLWTEVYRGDARVTDDVRSLPATLDSRKTSRYNVTFSTSGLATFYSTGSLDVVAYIGTSNDGVRDSDGVPISPLQSWDDVSSTDKNYRGTYQVEAGVTYYFYVKCKQGTDSGQISIYFVPPAAQTDRGYWIGISSGWRKLKVYIGNSSSMWIEFKPYIATGDSSPAWIDQY